MKNNNLFYIFFILSIFFVNYSKIEAAKIALTGLDDNTVRKISIFSHTTNPYLTISSMALTAGYQMEVTKTCDGSNVNENAIVACGEELTFRFRPSGQVIPNSGETSSPAFNYWFLTGSSNDTPYAKWVSYITTPTPYDPFDLAYTSSGEQQLSFYASLLVKMPDATLSNYSGSMTCGGRVFDGNGIYHYDCITTKKTGTYSPTFNAGQTQASLYYSYIKYDSYLKTTTKVPSTFLSSYTFPAASISYSLAATASPNEQNATCGTAATSYSSSATAYTGTFCAVGTAPTPNPSFPAAGGSISWTCTGIACGTSVTCTATRAAAPVNGACGTMAKAYAATDTAYSGTRCSTGTSNPTSPAFPAAGSSTTWSCDGSNGGTNASCTATRTAAATNGTCGSSNGTAVYTIPTTNLCTYTASTTTTVSGTGPWTWTCTGSNGGTNASCSAPKKIDGSCGGAAKVYSSTDTAFSGSLCNDSGTTTPTTVSYPSVGNSVTWTCSSPNGGLQSGTCTASRTAAAINGTCGTAATTYSPSATAFSGTLCSAGTSNPTNPTFPTSAGSSVSWICNGENGGTNSGSCTATRNAYNNCTGPDGTLIAHGGSKVYNLAPSVIAPATCTSENRVCNNGVLSGTYTYSFCDIGVVNLNPICQSYQNGIATTTILVNQDMEWKVIVGNPAPGDTSYTINSSLSGNFILDLSNSIISLTKLYQQTGVKTFSAQLTGVPSGRVGTCSTNANVVIGDQITVEQ